jgi:hypothetical protein
MTGTRFSLVSAAASVVVAGFALSWSGDIGSLGDLQITSQAEARVGRPATPMSYAGVARRTTRRAVAVGTAGAVYYPAPVVVAPAQPCTQRVDPYGRIVTVCY